MFMATSSLASVIVEIKIVDIRPNRAVVSDGLPLSTPRLLDQSASHLVHLAGTTSKFFVA